MPRVTKGAALDGLRDVRRRAGSALNMLDYSLRVDGDEYRRSLIQAAEIADQAVVDAQIAARAVRAYVARELSS